MYTFILILSWEAIIILALSWRLRSQPNPDKQASFHRTDRPKGDCYAVQSANTCMSVHTDEMHYICLREVNGNIWAGIKIFYCAASRNLICSSFFVCVCVADLAIASSVWSDPCLWWFYHIKFNVPRSMLYN